jgi:hypothetical protein
MLMAHAEDGVGQPTQGLDTPAALVLRWTLCQPGRVHVYLQHPPMPHRAGHAVAGLTLMGEPGSRPRLLLAVKTPGTAVAFPNRRRSGEDIFGARRE